MQTKHLGILSRARLGDYLERILQAYAKSISPKAEGVPRQILQIATQIDAKHVPHAREGPADTADDNRVEERD
eukprot:10155731-Karenia_brevis.AAC.1